LGWPRRQLPAPSRFPREARQVVPPPPAQACCRLPLSPVLEPAHQLEREAQQLRAQAAQVLQQRLRQELRAALLQWTAFRACVLRA